MVAWNSLSPLFWGATYKNLVFSVLVPKGFFLSLYKFVSADLFCDIQVFGL